MKKILFYLVFFPLATLSGCSSNNIAPEECKDSTGDLKIECCFDGNTPYGNMNTEGEVITDRFGSRIKSQILIIFEDNTSKKKIYSLLDKYDAKIIGCLSISKSLQLFIADDKKIYEIVEKLNDESIVTSAVLNKILAPN